MVVSTFYPTQGPQWSEFPGFFRWLLGGSSQVYSKWLGSSPCISHDVRPFGMGISLLKGDLRSPWLLTTYPNWDDPPSSQPTFPPYLEDRPT